MVVQQPAVHVATTHLVVGGGQSLGVTQAEAGATHPPPVPPVPVLDVTEARFTLADVEPPCGPPPEPGCSTSTLLVPHDPIPTITPTATRPQNPRALARV
jgi:hypothetical protein